jgi:hypothetical protein
MLAFIAVRAPLLVIYYEHNKRSTGVRAIWG